MEDSNDTAGAFRVAIGTWPPAALIFDADGLAAAAAANEQTVLNAIGNAALAVAADTARERFEPAIEMFGRDQRVIAGARCDLLGVANAENGAGIAFQSMRPVLMSQT